VGLGIHTKHSTACAGNSLHSSLELENHRRFAWNKKKTEIDLKNLGPTNQQKKKTWKYTGRILGQQAWEIYWKYIGKALPHISFGI